LFEPIWVWNLNENFAKAFEIFPLEILELGSNSSCKPFLKKKINILFVFTTCQKVKSSYRKLTQIFNKSC
jgi:hypothetical protein